MRIRIEAEVTLTSAGALHQRITATMRRQDRQRYQDPTYNPLAPKVWVVYAWEPVQRAWYLAGFLRGKKPGRRMRKLRKRLKLNEQAVLKVVDIYLAAKHGAGGPPEAEHGIPKYKLARPRGQRIMDLQVETN